MEHALQTAINRLPEILERNAPGMMRRIVARMKAQMEQDDRAGDLSHGLLFLKVGEEDLVREFLAATRAAFVRNEPSGFGGLSLEPEEGRRDFPEFRESDMAFAKLCENAARLHVLGADVYDKKRFIETMADAFGRARMDTRATAELTPYARVALDAELQGVYTKLNQLAA